MLLTALVTHGCPKVNFLTFDKSKDQKLVLEFRTKASERGPGGAEGG